MADLVKDSVMNPEMAQEEFQSASDAVFDLLFDWAETKLKQPVVDCHQIKSQAGEVVDQCIKVEGPNSPAVSAKMKPKFVDKPVGDSSKAAHGVLEGKV